MGALKRKLYFESALNKILGRVPLKSPFLLCNYANLKVQVFFSGSFPAVFSTAISRCLILEGDVHSNVN